MKKIISILISTLLLCTISTISVSAAPLPPEIEGPTEDVIGEWYEFFAMSPGEFEQIFYRFSNNDGTWRRWIGPCYEGEQVYHSYKWDSVGTYSVKVQSTFNIGTDYSESEHLIDISNPDNVPPSPIQPQGDTFVYVDETYSYMSMIDIDINIYYQFVWDDGTETDWIFTTNPENLVSSHSWNEIGLYRIKVKASFYPEGDPYSESSDLVIRVIDEQEPPEPKLELDIKGGNLQMMIKLKNTGNVEIEDIEWSIEIEPKSNSFIPFAVDSEGTISSLSKGSTKYKYSGLVFGFGEADVFITVEAPGIEKIEEEATALVFFFFVNIY